jgi:hypothetical protein
MTTQGSFCNKCASIKDGLLDSVGGLFAICGNVGPNLKDIGFG